MEWEWAKRLREAGGWEAEVGYPPEETPADFLDIVRINFLGSRDGEHPPPRPLLENALEEARAEGVVGRLVSRIVAGDRPEVALEEAAREVEDRAREALWTGEGLRDNAPATIAHKGYNAPLRDQDGEDRFVRYLTHRVHRRGPEGA